MTKHEGHREYRELGAYTAPAAPVQGEEMKAATPRPWRVFKTTDGKRLVGIGDKDGQGILDCGFGVWSWNDPEGIANAELVVKAVNSHHAIMAENKACYQRIDELELRVSELEALLQKSQQ